MLRQTGSNRDLHGSGADSCLRQLSAPLPYKSLLEPVWRSTCKADLGSHLGCSRLSQCCFLTCKPLACPRSMQVYRYSSQESTEQPKCKDLQRTLHPIRPHQTQSNLEVRRCRVSVLNKNVRTGTLCRGNSKIPQTVEYGSI